MKPRTLTSLFTLALLAALPAAAQADTRIASASGVTQVNGETVFVDVVVAVPRGQSDRAATDRALSEQGASRREKPPWAGGPGGGGGGGGDEFFYTGLEWTSFPVVQNYNSTGEPLSAYSALRDTQSAWSSAGSSFRFQDGGATTRCPSLVQQCKGPQVRDGFNDVGWTSIGGSTLGVTWSTFATPEADMALNTRFTWKATCNSTGGSGIDVESVFLHENGHVAGIDHTNRTDSVMYPSYQGPLCALTAYDQASIQNLY